MAENMADSIRAQNRAMDQELEDLQERVRALKVKYDRYFMGLDKIPPLRDRADLERDFRNSKLLKSHKTGVKFRFRNVRQSLMTNARRWDRIMRLIEEGKFKRDRNALRTMGASDAAAAEMEAMSGPPKRKTPEEQQQQGPDTRKVFETWQRAQEQLGKRTNVDYDQFRNKLNAQKQAQLDKYGWKDVNYSVKVKDGRVALVAKPVKDDP